MLKSEYSMKIKDQDYRIVSNKRSPSNKRPLTYFQIKLGKMPKILYIENVA